MFGSAYFGQNYFGQGYPSTNQVVFDNTSNSGYKASLSTYNWSSHNVTTQSNRIMLLEVAIFVSGSVSSATLGSQNFIFLRAKTNGVYRTETWYILSPNAGVNTITVNLSGSLTSIATEVTYYNANILDFPDAQGDNFGTGNPASISLTSLNNNSRMVGSLVTPTSSGVTDASGQNQRDIQSGALGTQVVSDSNNIPLPTSTSLTWNNIGTLDTWASTGVIIDVYIPPINITDMGTGLDSVSISVGLPLTDSGTGYDSILISLSLSISDTGLGTDNILISIAIPVTDSGTGTDTITLMATVVSTDSGTGTDSVRTAKSIILNDNGLGNDSVTIYQYVFEILKLLIKNDNLIFNRKNDKLILNVKG